MTSTTLDTIGVSKEIMESGNYKAVRKELESLDRETQGLEMQKLGTAPEWVVGAQKLVKDFDDGIKRLYEYCLPLEDEEHKKPTEWAVASIRFLS